MVETTSGAAKRGVKFLKPPVTLERLRTDIEHDPEGAEEFVALIRRLRNEGRKPPEIVLWSRQSSQDLFGSKSRKPAGSRLASRTACPTAA